MILNALSKYIKNKQRVDENDLLKHFHLHANGLAPMMNILINHGHIQKTINGRGERLSVQVFYSWKEIKVIPMITLL